ncbi:TPA: hypothetical protein HA278_03325 [Candidatus Woesearchaeota archaeon]|nr:hypothetical protein [Candidatus Woesearchaeota archaeon]
METTVMTRTKLTKNTLNLLKNFSSINSNILVEPGNKITTISPVKNVMSEATVSENFDTKFGIWDLNKFLGVISLFDDPTFNFEEKYVTIENSNGSSVRYHYSEPTLLTVPTKSISMPSAVVTFDLTQDTFSELTKAASVLQVSDLAVRSTESGTVELVVLDKNDVGSNTYSVDVGDMLDSESEFIFYFKVENLKIIEGDYTVDISDKNISQFTHSSNDVKYWIALETDSKYSK